jgi:hypothetical protein
MRLHLSPFLPLLLLHLHLFQELVRSSSSSHWTSTILEPTSLTTAFSNYGTSVAVQGNTVVVSSPRENVGSNSNAGVVYSFKMKDPNWSMHQRVSAPDGEAGDEFGCSISISPNGQFLIVGSKFHGIQDTGAVYLYYRTNPVSDDSWTFLTKLVVTNGVAGDLFGSSVALSNDHAVIAAPGKSTNSGSAYVFKRSGSTAATSIWSVMSSVLTSSTSAPANYFGASVSIFRHVIAVGVPNGDLTSPARENAGWVDVFVLDTNTEAWVRSSSPLTISDAKAYDYTGGDVSVGPGFILVASSLDDHTKLTDVGSVHSFTYDLALSNNYVSGQSSAVTYAFEQMLTLIDTTISEVHNITCEATTGSFRLSLGSSQTAAIQYNDNLNTLKSKLLALNNIDDITVNILDSNHKIISGTGQTTICSYPNPNGITITYHHTSHGRGGAMPALVYNPIDLDIVDANSNGKEASVVITVPTESNIPQDELHQSYNYAKFGDSVTVSPSGKFAAIGATHHIIGGKVNVYQYKESLPTGSRWTRLHGINASSPKDTDQNPINVWESGHEFGGSVALDDDHLVIGAPKADVTGQSLLVDRGLSFVYSLVPNPPELLTGNESNRRLTNIKWAIPFSNAADIIDYKIVATPVLGSNYTKTKKPSSIVTNIVNHTVPLGGKPQEMIMNEMTNLINGQAYNLTVCARSSVGSSLYSKSYGPLIPSTVPDVPLMSSLILSQETAQKNHFVGDRFIKVLVTVPAWNGGNGFTKLMVKLTAYSGPTESTEAVSYSKTITRTISNTNGKSLWWFNFTNLENGIHYLPTSKISNSVGYSTETITHTKRIVPASIPTSPIMSTSTILRGNKNATIYFEPPAIKTGALLHYVVTIYEDTSSTQNWTTSSSPLVLTGLTNGKTYRFVVKAYNWMGIGPNSLPSLAVIPADVPNAVEQLLALPGDMNITVRYLKPVWNGGSEILTYTIYCEDDQGIEQPSVTIAVDKMSTVSIETTASNGTIIKTSWYTYTFVNNKVPLVNGRKYTVTVEASNIIGTGASLSQLCWPVFNGLRDWEIALLIIAPFLIIMIVMVYIWRCKYRNPFNCKPIKSMKRAAVAPAPILELGNLPKKQPEPLSFLNTGLDIGLDSAGPKVGGYGGTDMFDALRTGQAIHVAQKTNSKRREKGKGAKRRQL